MKLVAWLKHFSLSFLLILVTAFLYSPSLHYAFFQDDFYLLSQSRADSLTGLISFFVPGTEIYYRPLSMRLYFWLVGSLFGFNPVVFHNLSLLIHLANSFLVWRLVSKLHGYQSYAWFSAALYATSSLHFISLFWIAEVGLLLGITFYLLTVISFIAWLQSRRRSHFIVTVIFFIIALLCHEYATALPLTLVALVLYFSSLKNGRWLVPFLTLDVLYLLLRLLIFPLKISGTYSLELSKASLKALFWYGVWSLNLLEHYIDQLEPGIKLRQVFLYDFLTYNLVSLSMLIFSVIFLLGIPLALYLNSDRRSRQRIHRWLIFLAFWLTATLTIPLLTPRHLYPLYGSLALIGITASIGAVPALFSLPRRRAYLFIILVVWISMSFATLRFTEKIHWTVQEATLVEEVRTWLNRRLPSLPPGSTIVLKKNHQLQQALFGELGLQLLYNDPGLKTFFGDPEAIMPQSCKMEIAKIHCLAKHNIFVK